MPSVLSCSIVAASGQLRAVVRRWKTAQAQAGPRLYTCFDPETRGGEPSDLERGEPVLSI
ncbi:hypothetical protein B1H18_07305 [Streptomyces tsukubensis]|uniref:Uncharacterized protein n=1 Tax=Streptomyces tsukubensis TaxID=83656 RepID=A0A1V4AD61_9ACTN|nr:hypothetical protein B1H18_07305 [Streptomyces tsukubensis]